MKQLGNTSIFFDTNVSYDEIEIWVSKNLDNIQLGLPLRRPKLTVSRLRSEIHLLDPAGDEYQAFEVIEIDPIRKFEVKQLAKN